MTSPATSVLECIYQHEKNLADKIFLTQPVGGGKVLDYTWAQTVDQSRRMAAHLKTLGLPHGAKVALLSKNCAHFFMAEMAIWMAGYTTVAIFPTESADTVKFVLQHSESSLLFVGKLDEWHKQAPGVPENMPRIALPLAPATPYDSWDSIIARTAPLQGDVLRDDNDLAMIIYTSGTTGFPKGVMHSQRSYVLTAEAFVHRMYLQSDERLMCVLPLFLYLLFAKDQRAGAALLLGVLGMTDWVDGWFARKFNQVSPFGAVFDPTVDRVLFVVSAISVLIDGAVPLWFCIAILVREIAVGAMMVVGTLMGMERFPVSNNGKWYTFLLMMAVPFLLLAGSSHVTADFGRVVGWLCAIPGLVLSYYTAVTYVPIVRANLRKGRAAKTLR